MWPQEYSHRVGHIKDDCITRPGSKCVGIQRIYSMNKLTSCNFYPIINMRRLITVSVGTKYFYTFVSTMLGKYTIYGSFLKSTGHLISMKI